MSDPLQCLILDDEPVAIRLLANYVGQTPGLVLLHHTTHIEEALRVLQQATVDVLFLDIQMPELNGLEFMQRCGERTAVIFTTAYREFAVEAFEKNAVDYLLKPISYERFKAAVTKAQKRKSDPKDKPDYLFVKAGFCLRRIEYETIFYVEALRDYILFHTTEGKILASESMTFMESILPADRFLRIHRSFIINKDKIRLLEKWAVTINSEVLPVGATYREKLMALLRIK